MKMVYLLGIVYAVVCGITIPLIIYDDRRWVRVVALIVFVCILIVYGFHLANRVE